MQYAEARSAAKSSGLKRYFTGAPCKYGHLSQRQTSDGVCIECNRTHRRIKSLEWQKQNRDMVNERVRPSSKKYNRTKYVKHRDKIRDGQREYYLDNKERFAERSREWSLNNPGKKAIHENKRKALKLGYDGEHYTADDVSKIYQLQNGKCTYCRTSLNRGYEVDHVVPLSAGGGNGRDNIQLLCRDGCNQRKGAKHPIEYARSIGMLL